MGLSHSGASTQFLHLNPYIATWNETARKIMSPIFFFFLHRYTVKVFGIESVTYLADYITKTILPSIHTENFGLVQNYLKRVRPPASPKMTGVWGGTWKYPFPF